MNQLVLSTKKTFFVLGLALRFFNMGYKMANYLSLNLHVKA